MKDYFWVGFHNFRLVYSYKCVASVNRSSNPLVLNNIMIIFLQWSGVLKFTAKQGPAEGVTPVLTPKQSYLYS